MAGGPREIAVPLGSSYRIPAPGQPAGPRPMSTLGSTVDVVDFILRHAASDGASDVHIEPTGHCMRVRNRVNGVLQDVQDVYGEAGAALATRFKVLANMDIAECRMPQDGRFSYESDGHLIDVRVTTLPTAHGESVVLHLLDRAAGVPRVDDLGLLAYPQSRFEQALASAWGMVLVTGPAGSGKSTTLYAALAELDQPGRNIVTVEDPIEYRLPGLEQVEVNPEAGLSCAAALRSILRADPDVVFISEIRDPEIAHLAAEAALTGHLVLSSLRTNDTVSALRRLVEMGVERHIVTSTVNSVLAQRLVRRLCPQCKVPYAPTGIELQSMGWPHELSQGDLAPEILRPGDGCVACSGTGYRGRFAIFEIMSLTDGLRQSILNSAPWEEVARQAVREGMATMREDGLRKVALGATGVEELVRVAADSRPG